MIKLQEIKRRNGSVINSLVLPKHIIFEAGLKKGDFLSVGYKDGYILLRKEV